MVFKNSAVRKIFGPGGWRKLHNWELHDLHCSRNIIRVIKSRKMRLVGHVARMWEERYTYWVLVGTPEGKGPLEILRHKLGGGGGVLFKLIIKNYDGSAWTGFIWLRI
jgi:hypothetical protein